MNSYLIKAAFVRDYVLLTYSDGESFLVTKNDYNRSFMCFLSFSKEAIKRDFMVT